MLNIFMFNTITEYLYILIQCDAQMNCDCMQSLKSDTLVSLLLFVYSFLSPKNIISITRNSLHKTCSLQWRSLTPSEIFFMSEIELVLSN